MADEADNKKVDGKVDDTNKKTDKADGKDVKDGKSGEKAFDENVFEDPRLWQHPRFKSLNERAHKADELEKAQGEAEEKRLIEQKKFEELATKNAKERDEAKSKLTSSIQDNRIITEATKVGVVDIETVLKLVDRSNIHVDENGNVTGATEAIQALITSKPFLKGKPGEKKIGSGSALEDDAETGVKKFKLSQVQNPAFYKEHEKEIAEAYKAHQIEDDVTKK